VSCTNTPIDLSAWLKGGNQIFFLSLTNQISLHGILLLRGLLGIGNSNVRLARLLRSAAMRMQNQEKISSSSSLSLFDRIR